MLHHFDISGSSVILNHHQAGNTNQEWMVYGDRIAMRSNTNSVLDIANGDSKPGAAVCAWEYTGGPNQRWSVQYA